MLNRRHVTGLLGAALSPIPARAQDTLPFYASTGPRLAVYRFDEAAAALSPASSVTLSANVQYAWPSIDHRFLYVAASNNTPGGLAPDAGGHCVQAFRVGAAGDLAPHGPPLALAYRPIHCTVHPAGFLLVAYNIPAGLTVHRLNPDGTIGRPVPQDGGLDTGIYAHQVRVVPGRRSVVLVTRGNDPRPGHPEDPGALKVFGFSDGRLSNLQSLAPHGQGLGFGPRHLDFDRKFAFVSLERENAICVYRQNGDGSLSAEPLFIRSALTEPDAKTRYPGQTAGPIHIHPRGGFVYQTNRGSGTVDVDGEKVWNGGLNDIAVWRIDPETGEPTRIQNIDSHGFETRTFTITPDGKLLIAASQLSMRVKKDGTVTTVSAGLALYRIGDDGRLTFLHKVDVDTGMGTQFWSGLLTMP